MRKIILFVLSFLLMACTHLHYPTVETVDEDYKNKVATFKTSIVSKFTFGGKKMVEKGFAFTNNFDAGKALNKLVNSKSRDFCRANSGKGNFVITRKTKKKEIASYSTHSSYSSTSDSTILGFFSQQTNNSSTTAPNYEHYSLLGIQCKK